MNDHRDTDPAYLLTQQYGTGVNLSARIDLHKQYSTNPYGWQRWVFDQLKLSPSARVLELGCGTAALWEENKEQVPSGWIITLSDFSPGMVRAAREHLDEFESRFMWQVIDVAQIPFVENSVDAVIANHMLYHVPHRIQSIRELARVLRQDGFLYAAINGRDHLKELDDLLRTWVPELVRDDTAETFGLETGGEQLAMVFPNIELLRYRDSLEITEVNALVSYILSTPAQPYLDDQRLARIRQAIDEEIQQCGAFRITKVVGLFRCSH